MTRKKIYRAGVIPYVQNGDEIQMMFMKPANKEYGGDSYQIAKGKQEKGENIKDTALREAKEELGLFIGNVTEIHSIGEWLGRTTVFIAEIKDKDMFGDPHHETGSVAWLTLDEFMDQGRDLHKPIVKAAYRKIQKVMEKNIEQIKEYFDITLYEMSNYPSNDTGLSNGTNLWVRTEPNGLPHTKYRIKLTHPQKGDAIFAIWGDTAKQVKGNWIVAGKDLKKIEMLVSLTKDSLRQHIDDPNFGSLQLGNALHAAREKVNKI